jgi:hypothetical protein
MGARLEQSRREGRGYIIIHIYIYMYIYIYAGRPGKAREAWEGLCKGERVPVWPGVDVDVDETENGDCGT